MRQLGVNRAVTGRKPAFWGIFWCMFVQGLSEGLETHTSASPSRVLVYGRALIPIYASGLLG